MPSTDIEKLIEEYAAIRRKFEVCKRKHKNYLSGNDNYIGIIGEYWAKVFLEGKYKKDINNSSADGDKSKKWVDFTIEHDDKTTEYVNVKAISSENKQGKSGLIKLDYKPEDEGECSIIIVKLDVDLRPEQLLYIKDIANNLKEKDIKYKSKPKNHIYFKYDTKNGFNSVFKYIYKYDIEDKKFIQKSKINP